MVVSLVHSVGVNFAAFLLCLVVRWFFEERQKRNGCESGYSVGVDFSELLLRLVVRWFFEERRKRNGFECFECVCFPLSSAKRHLPQLVPGHSR